MIQVREEYCPQNHRCPTLRVCPVHALSQDGFSAPKVDQETCIQCGACVRSCRTFVEVPEVAGSVATRR